MKKLFYLLFLALLLLLLPAAAAPDEAVGRVTKVVDGDTIDVQLQSHDGRISEDTIRIRLADVDSPEMSTAQGPPAKAYTMKWLQSAVVSLDLDDESEDPYGRWVAVVYLQKPDGTVENFNWMLVEAGQACVRDFSNNEFNPADWWGGQIPAGVCIKGESSAPAVTPVVSASSDGPFVGSSKSNKYHYPSCSGAKKIASRKPGHLRRLGGAGGGVCALREVQSAIKRIYRIAASPFVLIAGGGEVGEGDESLALVFAVIFITIKSG